MRWLGFRLGRPALLAGPAAVAASAFLLAGCGGSGSATPTLPTIPAARTFRLADFQPAGAVQPGKPATVSFRIDQPSGAPLTNYKRGAGPHTGVHLIIVRDDLGAIVHRHPPIGADGRLSESIVFPTPGRYRIVVDAYPNTTGPLRNFQLFRTITVAGEHKAQPLPPFAASEKVGGYRFAIAGKPRLKALQAAFMTMTVKGPNGKPARFTPWFGALAHAIFFRKGTLDYFHTHICSPGAAACANTLGGSTVAGTSSTPGKLHIGVLVPTPGTWRLFLQCKVDGKVLTAPFTLKVLPG
jgi:hypothetical protein